jgi:LmbE family N-acetylglucosaminyl deacetylase
MKNIVVFAPHPDDEVLGCGGTIVKKLMEGNNVFVIFMTDGRYGLSEMGVKENPDPLEHKFIRKKEALKAAETLGLKRENLFFLDIEDKTLDRHKFYALGKVISILTNIRPFEVYFPQELEYNVDHHVTYTIVKDAIKKSGLKTIEYCYAIAWKFPFNLLLHILNEQGFYNLMCTILKRKLLYVDISKFLEIKLKAIRQYASQLKIYSNYQKDTAIKKSILKASLKNEEKFFV